MKKKIAKLIVRYVNYILLSFILYFFIGVFFSLNNRINVCFWETAILPLPKPNILPKARSEC